jgi:hypothetical protein
MRSRGPPVGPRGLGATAIAENCHRRALGIGRASELRAEAEDHAKFVVTGTAPAYLLPAMKINPLPAGFVVPAQPVKAPEPPVGTDWVQV